MELVRRRGFLIAGVLLAAPADAGDTARRGVKRSAALAALSLWLLVGSARAGDRPLRVPLRRGGGGDGACCAARGRVAEGNRG